MPCKGDRLMAEILIRNMEMPKTCRDCRFAVNAYGSLTEGKCAVLGYGVTYLNKRCDACPLVAIPEHGRLIDAEKLKETLMKSAYPEQSEWYFAESCQFIDEAPTIVSASEGE